MTTFSAESGNGTPALEGAGLPGEAVTATVARPVAPTFARLDERNAWWYSRVSLDVVGDQAAGGLRLGSREQRPVPFAEVGGTFGGLTRPTGLAAGPDGRLFLADPGGDRILSYTPPVGGLPRFGALPPDESGGLRSASPAGSSGDSAPPEGFKPLWTAEPLPAVSTPGPHHLESPRGVAFSPDGDLVVADTGHGRVLVYAWPSLQTRRVIDLPGGEPWDVAHDAAGNLYVADSAAGRVWFYDRSFRRDSAYHGGEGVLQRPRHLAIAADGRLFVVDESPPETRALDGTVRKEAAVVELDSRGRKVGAFEVEHLMDVDLPLALSLEREELYLPQDRLPDCPKLLLPGIEVDRAGRLKGVGAMLLARPLGVRYPRNGRYVSLALDSGIVNCAWHRIVLEVELPPRTSVTVRTLTAAADMEPERVDTLAIERWSAPITLEPGAVPEALVQSGAGRYLWLRFDLVGDGETTPVVRAITVYAPRQSSLRFLPPVFQDDPVSADFVDRMLSYFDTVFAEIETKIEAFPAYLDPDSVPGEFLGWLGSWLDLTFLAEWSEPTRRGFIRRAIEFYKRRGTVEGLREFLQLHTGLSDSQPAVIEHFRLRDFGTRLEAGADSLPAGRHYIGGYLLEPGPDELAHHFTVVLPAMVAPDEAALATLRQLVEVQKPAHTAFQLRFVRPGLRIGCQSTIGVDTLVGDYPSEPLGEMRLGQSGRLGTPDDVLPKLGSTRLTSG